VGVLTLCFSVCTILFYYPILSIEIILPIDGILLFAFTYLTIRRLKNKETGVTFKPDRFTKTNAFLNPETLISSQLGMQPQTITESQMEFGGGDFSGDGSGGKF
jgi:cell division protein FtsW (lipid II flippase)